MIKISEQKALEEYPIKIRRAMDSNRNHRAGYIKGYDQAMQDFLEKACDWLKHTEGYIITSEGGDSEIDNTFIKDFKNYMQDE